MYIFPYFSRSVPLQVRQRLCTITLNMLNLQEAVFRQRVKYFSTEQIKVNAQYKCILPDFFFLAMLYYMNDIKVPDNNRE